MKRTIKFWTKEEDKQLIDLYKKTENQSEVARTMHRKLGRTVMATQFRLSKLVRKKTKPDSKGVTLPAGFTFDIKPNRVVMHNDHVRLYF